MKKTVLLSSLLLISACNFADYDGSWRDQLIGRDIYFCYDNEARKETITSVDWYVDLMYQIHTVDEYGTARFHDWVKKREAHRDMTNANYLAQFEKDFSKAPACSRQAYINKKQQLQQKFEQQQYQEQLQQQKEQQDNADCNQAKARAAQRLNSIKTSLEASGNGSNIVPELNGRVVDFASDGIMIINDCSAVWGAGMLFGQLGYMLARNNCKEERLFIYTNDTDYATGESFRDRGLIYQRVGNYRYTTITGSLYSVPAYRATPYRTEEIDYRTYLNNGELYCH